MHPRSLIGQTTLVSGRAGSLPDAVVAGARPAAVDSMAPTSLSLRAPSMDCAFCGKPSPLGTYDRMAGLDVCSLCRKSGVLKHLLHRGYLVTSRYRIIPGSRQNGGRTAVLEIDITLPVDPGLHLRCVKESWTHAIQKLFRNEIQVGDPIFDDHIYISKGSGAAITDLLSHEGIQSAILLVGIRGTFVLEGPRLTARCSYRIPPSARERRDVELEVAAAAIHIAAWHRAR